MVKSLQKWLEKSGYNPEKIKLFGGGEALEVSTPYQGQTPTAEQFANCRRCVCDTKNKRLFFPCRMCSGLV